MIDDSSILAAVCVIALLAGMVKGTVAFGFSLTAAPPLALVLAPGDVLVALVLPTLFLDASLATGSRPRQGRSPLLIPVVTAGLFGAAAGALAIDHLDERALAAGVGVTVIVLALVKRPRHRHLAPATSPRMVGLGSCAGFFAGCTGFFGPPTMLYLQRFELSKQVLAATASVAFVWFGVFRLISMASLGLVGTAHLMLSAVLLGPGLVGCWFGWRLRRRLSEEVFRRLVRATIVMSAVVLIATKFA